MVTVNVHLNVLTLEFAIFVSFLMVTHKDQQKDSEEWRVGQVE